MILDFMQVKKEILKVSPLEVGRGGLLTGRPKVPMIFYMYFLFFLQNKRKCSLDYLVLTCMLSSLSLELPLIM